MSVSSKVQLLALKVLLHKTGNWALGVVVIFEFQEKSEIRIGQWSSCHGERPSNIVARPLELEKGRRFYCPSINSNGRTLAGGVRPHPLPPIEQLHDWNPDNRLPSLERQSETDVWIKYSFWAEQAPLIWLQIKYVIEPTTWHVRSIVNLPEGCCVSVKLSFSVQSPVLSEPSVEMLTGQAKMG
jgi:hypothetical protein